VIVPRSFIAELLREQLAPWIDDPDAVQRRTRPLYRFGLPGDRRRARLPGRPHRRRRPLAGGARSGPAQRRRLRPRGAHPTRRGQLFAAIGKQRYDLIIANPPYVNAESMATLPAEYRREPELALASGEDGLDLTRAILAGARKHLKPTACWSSRSATTASSSKPRSRPPPSPGSTPAPAISMSSCCIATSCREPSAAPVLAGHPAAGRLPADGCHESAAGGAAAGSHSPRFRQQHHLR
jgi:hypothetical protein